MNVVILQTNIDWADAVSNRKRAECMMDDYKEADLFVLPEMFSTGFCMTPELVAEEQGGDTLLWMRRMALEHSCAVAGSVSVKENDIYYNRFYFVCPDGTVYSYDKRHLFTYSGENLKYTAGDKRVIVSYGGFRILLQICYDLRFPVWSRCRGDYDVAIYVANWPSSRREVWNVLLKARSLENQCYVIGVNRVGEDPSCVYDGGSVVLSPYGKVLGACADGKEEAVSVILERAPLDSFRKRFPVLNDGDIFQIEP